MARPKRTMTAAAKAVEVKEEVKEVVREAAKAPAAKAEAKAADQAQAKTADKADAKANVKAEVKAAPKAESEKTVVVEFGGKQIKAKDVLAQAREGLRRVSPGNGNQDRGALHLPGAERGLLRGERRSLRRF